MILFFESIAPTDIYSQSQLFYTKKQRRADRRTKNRGKIEKRKKERKKGKERSGIFLYKSMRAFVLGKNVSFFVAETLKSNRGTNVLRNLGHLHVMQPEI